MLHRLPTLSSVVVVGLAIAGIAGAAIGDAPCHPDLPGTRSLSVTGHVTGYRFAGRGTVVVAAQTRRCAGVARWNYAATVSATASISCAASNSGGSHPPASHLVSAQGDRLVRVVLAPAGVDRPDRLDVFGRATGRRIASWPLFDRPTRVALFGRIAILSEAGKHALYAMRISDGRIAVLGMDRNGDRPIIGRDGVVYQDAMSERDARIAPNRVALKLVPIASVESQLALADQQIRTAGKISAMGMDGRRVVYATRDLSGKCDAVHFWSPPWHFDARVTRPGSSTCLHSDSSRGVTNAAMAGVRLIWTTQAGATTRVHAASAIGCKDWVVARPGRGASVAALAGDGAVLAYALKKPGAVGVVWADDDDWYGTVLARSAVPVTAISVDSNRIATLFQDGSLTITGVKGESTEPVSSFSVGPARAVALRGDTLAVLRSGHLDLFDAQTGLETGSWPVATNARSVDLQYGIAVIVAGGDVYAVNVHTGRTARLLHGHGRAAAQVDTPGAVVQFNAGGHGYLRFVPMSTLEARTR